VNEKAFKEYVDGSEKLRIPLRFLELKDEKVFIIEWPSVPHEVALRKFESRFLQASGNMNQIGQRGSFTAHRAGTHNKEADATFGPLRDTPNRNNPPAGIDMVDWVTLAVEVAVSQSWTSLEAAELWWASYPGVQYVICIKLSPKAKKWSYRLYDITQQGVPQIDQHFSCSIAGAGVHLITLDTRRILSIPEDMPLPPGCSDQIVIDLYDVAMDTRRVF
jgi:hypothetical protein